MQKLLRFGLGFLLLSACGSSDEGGQDTPTSRPVEYTTISAYGSENAPLYVGQIQNSETAPLSFEVGGVLQSLSVDLGDRFEARQVLGRLQTRNYDLEIDRRTSAIAQAQAEGVNAQQDFDRKNALKGTGAISGAAIDAARARLDGALSNQEGLKTALAQAQKSRSDTFLRADFAGTVLERLAQPGQTLAVGQSVLSVSKAGQPLEAVISVTQRDIGRFKIGDILPVRLTASDAVVLGTVSEIATTAENTLSFPVRLTLEPNAAIFAGMGIEVRLVSLERQSQSVLVPLTAVQIDSSGAHYIYEITEDNLAKRVPVAVETLVDKGYVLSRAPQAGTKIISHGAVQVKEGETLNLLDSTTRRYPE